MYVALTRAVSPSMARCELTHLERSPIDVAVAAAQHAAYEGALRSLGVRVERVEPAPDLPDSVFIEDAAVVLDEIAVLMRPGAESRRGELAAVSRALARYRTLVTIDPPGTMDGGDVLQVGRRVFVGRSSRTNDHAIGQLRDALAPFGYAVEGVDVHGCLHLKSAATAVSEDLVVVNPDWIDPRTFAGLDWVAVHPGERSGANVVRVRDSILSPASAPETTRALQARVPRTIVVNVAELAKAEGALTCCSLVFSDKGLMG